MSFELAENRRVAAALLYLQATTFAGALKRRLRRLRQPKYLLGALFFVGYFGLMFGRSAWQYQHAPAPSFDGMGVEAVAALAALAYFGWAVTAWLFPSGRTNLRFSEAEIAFLFPAPLTRVGLINFSLLRAQLPIFLSAFLLSLFFGRGRGLPGNAFQHATALWLAVATLRMHSLGASFTIDRFADSGANPFLRRALVPLLVLLLLGGLLAWVALVAPPAPAIDGSALPRAFAAWVLERLHSAPLSVVLAPFHWLAAPMTRGGDLRWWLSLLPPVALLLGHYLWVVRASLGFEEASIAAAAKRARQADNLRTGRWPWRTGKRTANNEPFVLAGRGTPALGFLWSGLIGAGGGLWRPRNVGAIALATLLFLLGLAASPWAFVLPVVGGVAGWSAMMFVMLGTKMMQGRLVQILEVLDIYKAAPLPGKQIALGQLLTPVALGAFGLWYALFVAVVCVLAGGGIALGKLSFTWVGVFGVALVGPLLSAVLMCIPFAWILWFPAWASSLGTRNGGFEVAGQRLLFTFVYLLAAAAAMLPGLALGGLVAWVGALLALPSGVLLFVAILVAATTLVLELAAIVELLGARIDRLDVSTELR
jgi:hypothetical protein